MDMLLETQPKEDKNRECDHKNKWRSYRKGLHTPSPDLVSTIETTIGGGYGVLNHVLWKALRRDHAISSHADRWIGELHPEIQRIVYQLEPKQGFGKKIRQSLNRTQLTMLEHRAGSDALACLVILLRRAAENDDGEFAQRLGWRVCRMLLVLAPVFAAMGIETPLVQYFEQEILPLGSSGGRHYQFRSGCYQTVAKRLSFLANLVEGDENRAFTNAERITLRIDILDGRRGDILGDPISPVPTNELDFSRNR